MANMANNKTSISSFDFSSETNLNSFLYSSGLDLNGSSWDVSGVTSMQNLFGFGTKVSGIEEWDVSGLNSYNVFSYAGSVDADISGWSNTVPGTYLVKAFHSASENIRGIENWDLKNNTNLAETFKQSNVNADISGWDFEKASNLDDMIYSSSMSIDNLEKLLARLASQDVINNVDFDMNGVFHTTDSDSHITSLTNDDSWNITNYTDGYSRVWNAFTLAATDLSANVNEKIATNITDGTFIFTEGGGRGGSGESNSANWFKIIVENVQDAANEQIIIDGSTIALSNGGSGTTTTNSYPYEVVVTDTNTSTIRFGTKEYKTPVVWKLFTEIDPIIKAAQYKFNSDDIGSTNTRTISIRVQDRRGKSRIVTANSLTVNAINDAPTLTANATSNSALNDGSTSVKIFKDSNVSASESDQNITEVKITVTGDGGSGELKVDGVYQTISSPITLTGTWTTTQFNTLINGLEYRPANGETGDTEFTITSVKDSGGTANGGVDTNATLSIASTVSVTGATIALSGTIAESSEDGDAISVNLTEETFSGSISNVTVNNLPSGVTASSTSGSGASFTINLSGNRTTDYDSDITNVQVVIDAGGLSGSQNLSANSGVTFQATVGTDGLERITPAAAANSATSDNLPIGDYEAVATGATSGNLAFYNDVLDTTVSVTTATHVQNIVNAVNKVITSANGSNDDNDNLSQSELETIGVTGIDTTNKATLLADVIDGKASANVDRLSEVQAFANIVVKVMAVANGGTSLTHTELTSLGVAEVNASNEALVIGAIAGTANDGSAVDTIARINTLVTNANTKFNDAINSNTTDVTSFTKLGLSKVTSNNIAAINTAIAAVSPTTFTQLEDIVNAYYLILTAADSIEDSDATPDVAGFNAIGVTDVNGTSNDAALIKLIKNIIDTQDNASVDTVTELQALVNIARKVVLNLANDDR
jgi:hypothetical protein